jgi:hypothetical protein
MLLEDIGNNTFRYKYKDDTEVDIGNKAVSQFRPHLNFKRWKKQDGTPECEIGLGFPGINSIGFSINGDEITAENVNFKFGMKPTPINKLFNELGGYDWIITLKKKPPTNSFSFSYNPVNVVAYHQPPLTQEFTAGWSDEFQCEIAVTETDVTRVSDGKVLDHRPEHVVNSIAFYHATKGRMVTHTDADRGLTTGKVGHLYRMKVTDSASHTTWANWTLSGNAIILTVDSVFLNSAIYPVVIAPVGDTFGYTSEGGSDWSIESNEVGQVWACPSAGEATGMSAYLETTTYKKNAVLLIYDALDPDSNPITNGLCVEKTVNLGSDAKVDFVFIANPTLAATNYRLVAWGASGSGAFYVNYDDAVGFTADSVGQTYDPDLSDYGDNVDWAQTADRKVSVFCTFTPSGGSPQTITPGGIATAEAFGTLKANLNLAASGIGSAEAIGSPQANLKLAISGIESGEAIGDPIVMAGVLYLQPDGIESGEAFGTSQLNFKLAMQGINSSEQIGAQKLSLKISPEGIVSAESFLSNLIPTNTSFETGDPPTDWSLWGIQGVHANWSRSDEQAKTGSYSVKLQYLSAYPFIHRYIADYANYRGRTVTLGCWAYATVANKVSIAINDGIGATASAYHTGSSTWEWLTITKSISASATELQIRLFNLYTDIPCYFDDAIIFEVTPRLNFSVSPTGIISLEEFGVPNLKLYLLPTGVASSEAFGTTKLNYKILVVGIDSSESFGTLSISLTSELFILPSGIVSGEEFGNLTVSVLGAILLVLYLLRDYRNLSLVHKDYRDVKLQFRDYRNLSLTFKGG